MSEEQKKDLLITPIKKDISKVQHAAMALSITHKDDLPKATELLGRIKYVGKIIKNRKEEIIRPRLDALASARALFKPLELQYKQAEDVVKTKMLDFYAEQEAKKKKLEDRVDRGTMRFDTAVAKMGHLEVDKTVESTSSIITYRTVKEVVVKDEKKIPVEYFVPDMVRIRKDALAGVAIPGVEVVEKKTIASKLKM